MSRRKARACADTDCTHRSAGARVARAAPRSQAAAGAASNCPRPSLDGGLAICLQDGALQAEA
eukprot:1946009-Alexandrium_andersonii.AAC.1